MKIGIIVHSITGNTYLVAERLMESLISAGHTVNMDRISAVEKEPVQSRDFRKLKLKALPTISQFDVVILAAPVHGFSISEVMQAYLSQIDSLQGKSIVCLATQAFPFTWMGGNRSIKQLKGICEVKGAKILGTGIVNWPKGKRDKLMAEVVENLAGILNLNL